MESRPAWTTDLVQVDVDCSPAIVWSPGWQVSAVRLPSDASAVAMLSLPGTPPPVVVVGEDHRAFGDQPG
ncbi:MAG TPA: hypothetical protein VFW21_10475 [Mycobacterium sp.]|nr:hypothetical protein [Mycobacterium sp.]